MVPAASNTSLAALDEQQRGQAMTRFAVLRPYLEEGVRLTRAAGGTSVTFRPVSSRSVQAKLFGNKPAKRCSETLSETYRRDMLQPG